MHLFTAQLYFLFPVLLITEFPDQVYAVISAISKFISINFFLTYGLVETVSGFLDLTYWCLAFEYSFYRLTYLHFGVLLGFLGFSVYRLIKEKNWKQFFVILLLILLSAVLNYYWLMHGGPYTVV